MKYDESGKAFIIESPDDFVGWTIIGIEEWKLGVKRVSMTRPCRLGSEFRMVYSADEYTKNLSYDPR